MSSEEEWRREDVLRDERDDWLRRCLLLVSSLIYMRVSICIYLPDGQGNGRPGLSLGASAALRQGCRAGLLSLVASVIHRSLRKPVGVPWCSVVLLIELLWISQRSSGFFGVPSWCCGGIVYAGASVSVP